MVKLAFTKMHGLGNDFIVFDAPASGAPGPAALRGLANRHTGIGFDQALMLETSTSPDLAGHYRIFNADGSEVSQCGNGARCVARVAWEKLGRPSGELRLSCPAGTVTAQVGQDGLVTVGMGGDVNLPMTQLVAKEVDLRGTFRFHPEFATAVRFLNEGLIDGSPVITRVLPLERAVEAFELAADKSQSLKVQIAFDDALA